MGKISRPTWSLMDVPALPGLERNGAGIPGAFLPTSALMRRCGGPVAIAPAGDAADGQRI